MQCKCKNQSCRRIKAIDCFTGKTIIGSETELARKLGYKRNTISTAVNNNRLLGSKKGPSKRIIYEHQQGEQVVKKRCENMKQAVLITKCSEEQIKESIRNHVDVKGYRFYEDGWLLEKIDTINKHGKKRIMNIDTGKCYPSITDAAKNTGLHRSGISTAIKTGRMAGGYHWIVVN